MKAASPERRLDEFTKDEWWDVLQRAVKRLGGKPVTRERFEEMWAEFQAMKEARAKRLATQ